MILVIILGYVIGSALGLFLGWALWKYLIKPYFVNPKTKYSDLMISESDVTRYFFTHRDGPSSLNMLTLLGYFGSFGSELREVDKQECHKAFIEILKSKNLEVPSWLGEK